MKFSDYRFVFADIVKSRSEYYFNFNFTQIDAIFFGDTMQPAKTSGWCIADDVIKFFVFNLLKGKNIRYVEQFIL